MRSLSKADVPATIRDKKAELTSSYIASEGRTVPWKARDIVASLAVETSDKCAYCESRVGAVAWTHVEHIKPKSLFPELVVDWANLTLACPRCNQYKGDYHSDEHPLMNPYTDSPEAHLLYFFGMVRARPGDQLASDTIRILRLHRLELQDRRVAAVERVDSLVHDWARADGPLKEAIEELIAEHLEDGAEYAASIRAYLDSVGFEPSARVAPPAFTSAASGQVAGDAPAHHGPQPATGER